MANSNHKTRLELTWIGKENRPRLEPRIILEDAARSHHAKTRRGPADPFDKPWAYVLIPHDAVSESTTLPAFVGRFSRRS